MAKPGTTNTEKHRSVVVGVKTIYIQILFMFDWLYILFCVVLFCFVLFRFVAFVCLFLVCLFVCASRSFILNKDCVAK